MTSRELLARGAPLFVLKNLNQPQSGRAPSLNRLFDSRVGDHEPGAQPPGTQDSGERALQPPLSGVEGCLASSAWDDPVSHPANIAVLEEWTRQTITPPRSPASALIQWQLRGPSHMCIRHHIRRDAAMLT
jgi:hypothetical protein